MHNSSRTLMPLLYVLLYCYTQWCGNVKWDNEFNLSHHDMLDATDWLPSLPSNSQISIKIVAEQTLRCMTPGSFNWFLHSMLFYHTKYVLKNQDRKRKEKEIPDS